MAVINELELEHSCPENTVKVERFFVQWFRPAGVCRQRTVVTCAPWWQDVMCDVNRNGGTKTLEHARAVMGGLHDGRDPASEVEWRILKRTFEIAAEVVE